MKTNGCATNSCFLSKGRDICNKLWWTNNSTNYIFWELESKNRWTYAFTRQLLFLKEEQEVNIFNHIFITTPKYIEHGIGNLKRKTSTGMEFQQMVHYSYFWVCIYMFGSLPKVFYVWCIWYIWKLVVVFPGHLQYVSGHISRFMFWNLVGTRGMLPLPSNTKYHHMSLHLFQLVGFSLLMLFWKTCSPLAGYVAGRWPFGGVSCLNQAWSSPQMF